jgi:glycosyltransferase involved in cell wall biosynthesis
MPVKNTAPFLSECLDSICSQTYSNWELLAVNDFSSDNSREILAFYAQNDSRIKLIENREHGIVPALQMAYEQSKGRFITRMDSDDINEPSKYETMLLQLKKSGTGHIAMGKVKYFSEEGVKDGFMKYEQWLNRLIETGNCFDEIYKECPIPSPCWMLYKEDLAMMGGICTSLIPEDYDLAFRIYQNGLKCLPASQVLLNWRDRPQRTSRTHSDYTNEKMLLLKCHYFLEIDFDVNKNVILWGAGNRGKFIANYLVKHKVSFTWVCNNEKKIGHDIYGVVLEPINKLKRIEDLQIIVSVANSEEQESIVEKCKSAEWETYFFC